MNDDDILPLEAMHLLSQASDDMLRLAAHYELDLNRLARNELRSRGSAAIEDRLQQMYIHKAVKTMTL